MWCHFRPVCVNRISMNRLAVAVCSNGRLRTFIARTLISFANRCADLAQRAAPWISAP